MTHLSPAQVVDVADGCATPALAAHAATCESCRPRVESILDAARLAAEDPRPEPSPFFWPQLAARIGEAVRREEAPGAPWRSWVWRLAPLGAAAVLMVAVGVGSRLWTPGSESGGPAAPVSAPAQAADAPLGDQDLGDELVNINTASSAELDTLPGIGPTTAQKIIDYRTQNRPFQTIEDIMNVSGIGPGTFERLKDKITVGS